MPHFDSICRLELFISSPTVSASCKCCHEAEHGLGLDCKQHAYLTQKPPLHHLCWTCLCPWPLQQDTLRQASTLWQSYCVALIQTYVHPHGTIGVRTRRRTGRSNTQCAGRKPEVSAGEKGRNIRPRCLDDAILTEFFPPRGFGRNLFRSAPQGEIKIRLLTRVFGSSAAFCKSPPCLMLQGLPQRSVKLLAGLLMSRSGIILTRSSCLTKRVLGLGFRP